MTIAEIISKIFLPLSLAIIMLGMGLSLTIDDFTRIIKYPKSIIIGLTNQLLFLPMVGFILAISFNLNPIMAIGLMLIASCPGGPISNLLTQVCKGNIALSVTLTAITSVISIFTIPLILSYTLKYFGNGMDIIIQLPIIDTILQIMIITVIPILIGMSVRKFKLNFAIYIERPLRKASTVIFILVFISVVYANFELVSQGIQEVGFVTLILNILTLSLGYLSASLFNLNSKNITSITIESGIQNGTLAFTIASFILDNIEIAIPTAAYVIWMYTTGGILMYWLGNKTEKFT